MVKKGFLKKTGCILISLSIILAGFTFFGSTTSEADGDVPAITEENPALDTEPDDLNIEEGLEPTEEIGEQPEEEATVNEIVEEVPATVPLLKAATMPVLRSTSNETEPEYSDDGKTLTKVPAGISTFEVPANVTKIATGAFATSNVTNLIFAKASKITEIGSQGSNWPPNGLVVSCPNDEESEAPVVVEHFKSYAEQHINVEIHFGTDSVGQYTITYLYKLIDSTGAEVVTLTVGEEDIATGNMPTGRSDTTYLYSINNVSYSRVASLDPVLYRVTQDAEYTYTFQSSSADETPVNVTIVYKLDNKDVTITTLRVTAGTTPSYDAPEIYKEEGGKTYTLKTSPTITPVLSDTTLTYVYTSSGSGSSKISLSPKSISSV